MKTCNIRTVAVAVTVAFAALFVTSCDLIDKISETDIPVGDFSFNIDVAPTVGTTRAGGGTLFSGSGTVLRTELLRGISGFDNAIIKW